jgi:anti-anti-sigma factor
MGPPHETAGDVVRRRGSGRDGHVLLLSGAEDDRWGALAAWVQRGLDLGEQVACTQAAAGPSGPSVEAVLAEHGVPAKAAVHDGALRLLAVEAFYPPGAQARLADEAVDAGFTGYRMAAEAATALSVMPPEGYAEFEHALEDLTHTRRVAAMCQYDRVRTRGQRLDRALAVHPEAVREVQLTVRCAPGWLTLEGEADRDNADVLAAVVRLAGRTAPDATVRVDLRGLSFLDVGGLRALAAASRPFRDAGNALLLLDPPPGVARVLSLLGVEALAGVRVLGGMS